LERESGIARIYHQLGNLAMADRRGRRERGGEKRPGTFPGIVLEFTYGFRSSSGNSKKKKKKEKGGSRPVSGLILIMFTGLASVAKKGGGEEGEGVGGLTYFVRHRTFRKKKRRKEREKTTKERRKSKREVAFRDDLASARGKGGKAKKDDAFQTRAIASY